MYVHVCVCFSKCVTMCAVFCEVSGCISVGHWTRNKVGKDSSNEPLLSSQTYYCWLIFHIICLAESEQLPWQTWWRRTAGDSLFGIVFVVQKDKLFWKGYNLLFNVWQEMWQRNDACLCQEAFVMCIVFEIGWIVLNWNVLSCGIHGHILTAVGYGDLGVTGSVMTPNQKTWVQRS